MEISSSSVPALPSSSLRQLVEILGADYPPCMQSKDGMHSNSAAERRLFEALEAWFENEAADERLEETRLTRVELSPDRRTLSLFYLCAEEQEDLAAEALDTSLPVLRDLVEEELSGRRPELRPVFDRGARNQRRVEQILDELGREKGRSQN